MSCPSMLWFNLLLDILYLVFSTSGWAVELVVNNDTLRKNLVSHRLRILEIIILSFFCHFSVIWPCHFFVIPKFYLSLFCHFSVIFLSFVLSFLCLFLSFDLSFFVICLVIFFELVFFDFFTFFICFRCFSSFFHWFPSFFE